MVNVNTDENIISINVSSHNTCRINITDNKKQTNNLNASGDGVQFYTNLAKDWAQKLNDTVDGVDYSAKYCALLAKNEVESGISEINDIINDTEEELETQIQAAINELETRGNEKIAQAAQQVSLAEEQAQIAASKVQEISAAVTDKADNIDVVHKTGDETINGTKTFQDNEIIIQATAANSFPGVITENNNITYEQIADSQSGYLRGARVLSNVKDNTGNSFWYSYSQSYLSTDANGLLYAINTNGVRLRDDDGTYITGSAATVKIDKNGTALFDFPKCTSRATTTSSARNDKVAVITLNYVNGTSWYRIWSDGWIEQGGYVANDANTYSINKFTITFLKTFQNTNYCFSRTDKIGRLASVSYPGINNSYYQKSNNKIVCPGDGTHRAGFDWYACGY